MNQRSDHHYEFGPFRLDVAERLLLRDGESVTLTPKSFDLLLALVERQGHLLEKDELLKLVWPDTFVEETNLSYNISLIRKALGDGENGQRYIETVPKRGYRFVAEVRGREESAPAASKPPVFVVNRLMKQWRGTVIALAILLLVGVAAALSSWPVARQPAAPSVDVKSIAVLPLRALQASERDEALEMGATSILITRLGSLRQLIVRPESAVEKYARPDQDPLTAGREQKVDAVLDSRYHRSGARFRFTLRLLRVADGATLWSDTLDQQAADLFALEDALSSKVTGAFKLTLESSQKELLTKRYTNSAEAWQLYVRVRQLLHNRRIPNIEKAITYFQRAIALDNSFALANAMLGFSYTSLNWVGHPSAKKLMPKAKIAFDQALKLDDQLAEAHTYLASYKDTYEWDFDGAEQEHRRAINLNNNSADTHHHYALHLAYTGRFEQAISEIRKAEELDPTDPFINRSVALLFFFARRYDEVIEKSRQVVELDPKWGPGYVWMVRAYEMKGDEQGAFNTYLERAEAFGYGTDEIANINAAFAKGGLKGLWKREIDKLLEQEKSGYVLQYRFAVFHAQLGEKEQALARLQRAAEDRNVGVAWIKVEPLWDKYRTDPRFIALMRRVGLTQ